METRPLPCHGHQINKEPNYLTYKERPRCRRRIQVLDLRLAGRDRWGQPIVIANTGDRVFVSEGLLRQMLKQASEPL